MIAILIFFVLHWYLSLFAQTFFHHRYAAHRAFTMSKGWEKFFFLYSYIMQGSSYMSPRVYGILHRMHHAYTDTELDPHSPSYDSNWLKMMWRTSYTYVQIMKKKMPIEERFLKNIPEHNWLDRWGNTWYSRILWAGSLPNQSRKSSISLLSPRRLISPACNTTSPLGNRKLR